MSLPETSKKIGCLDLLSFYKPPLGCHCKHKRSIDHIRCTIISQNRTITTILFLIQHITVIFVLYDDFFQVISSSEYFVVIYPTKQGRNCRTIYDVLFVLWRIILIMWWYGITLRYNLVNIDSQLYNFCDLISLLIYFQLMFLSYTQTP